MLIVTIVELAVDVAIPDALSVALTIALEPEVALDDTVTIPVASTVMIAAFELENVSLAALRTLVEPSLYTPLTVN